MLGNKRQLTRFSLGILAVACWLLPLASGAAAHPNDVGSHEKEQQAGAEGPSESDSKTRGIGLGEYHIRAYYPVEAKRSTVAFTLYGIVPSENAAEFERLLENRK